MAEEKIKEAYEARIVQLEQHMNSVLISQGSSILAERELQKT